MKTGVLADDIKCRMLQEENSGWQNTLRAQVNEIPKWKSKLITGGIDTRKNEGVLYSQLFRQQVKMNEMEEELVQQQRRLEKNGTLQHEDDIESFCMQDVLRERIKEIEKTYIELKCNFLNYVSNIT